MKTIPLQTTEKTALGIDDMHETTSSFMQKISAAKSQSKDFIETTPEMIKLMQPDGLGTAKYFWYHGIRVFEYGTKEEIETGEKVGYLQGVLHEDGVLV